MLRTFLATLRAQWMGALALFLVIAGGTAYAANTVGSSDIIDESILSQDLKNGEVNSGHISIGGGSVGNARCKQFDASVGGAKAGEAVVFSAQGALQNGILLYGQRVPSDGHVTFDVCNFSGTIQDAITNLPVRVITFG